MIGVLRPFWSCSRADTRYSKQEYVHDDLFPSSWVEEKRKDGRFITSMATSKGRWAVVMSVDPSVEEQVPVDPKKNSSFIPKTAGS